MKTFSINTLGCKVNQYESQQIREHLERLGLDQVETFEKPDLVVTNTCCVTISASSKSRQYIRKAQKLNPKAVIVVSGCLPRVQIGELNCPDDKNFHIIRHQGATAAALSQIVNGKAAGSDSQGLQTCQHTSIRTENDAKIKCKTNLTNQPKLPQLTAFKGQTRAFSTVCRANCTKRQTSMGRRNGPSSG